MKLRLHANSLRLRLNRAELSTFAVDRRIEDSIAFGAGAQFTFSLEMDRSAAGARAVYEPSRIRVLVAEAVAQDWIGTDRVGIESTPSSGPKVLIEKDFQCLHREGDDPDAYPNPLASIDD